MRRTVFPWFYVLSAILMIAGACGEGDQSSADAEHIQPLKLTAGSSGIEFNMHRFLRESAACQNGENHCARIRAEYPVAVSGPEEVQRFINDTVFHYVVESLSVYATSEEDLISDLDSIAGRFIDSYEQYAEDAGGYGTSWEIETIGEVLFQSSKISTVALRNYSYTGGAHPNTYIYLLNFDRHRRELIQLEDIVENLNKLKQVVEEKFREFHQLEAGVNLNEAGFFWDQALFLPVNFAVKEKGLYLYYNSYEAAPYAMGPTEILIPWQQLKSILKEERIF